MEVNDFADDDGDIGGLAGEVEGEIGIEEREASFLGDAVAEEFGEAMFAVACGGVGKEERGEESGNDGEGEWERGEEGIIEIEDPNGGEDLEEDSDDHEGLVSASLDIDGRPGDAEGAEEEEGILEGMSGFGWGNFIEEGGEGEVEGVEEVELIEGDDEESDR